jgi:hypothetical protein
MFSVDPRQTLVWPGTAAPTKHKFDSRVESVEQRDGCSKTTAMQHAPQEFPDTYACYQRWHSSSMTSKQAMSCSRL